MKNLSNQVYGPTEQGDETDEAERIHEEGLREDEEADRLEGELLENDDPTLTPAERELRRQSICRDS